MDRQSKLIVKILTFSLTFYGAVISFYFNFFKNNTATNNYIAIIVFGFFPLLFLFVPFDKFIEKIIPKLTAKNIDAEFKKIVGRYHLVITFADKSKKILEMRSGDVDIKLSVSGFSIRGAALFDTKDAGGGNKQTMESWDATTVEILRTTGGFLLVYVYQTNEGAGSAQSGRTGVTMSFSPKEDNFHTLRGNFFDISGAIAERREGNVVLSRIP